MSEERLGFECKAYRNTGTDASPTWSLMDRVQDVSVNMSKDRADVPRRGSKWKYQRGAMLTADINLAYLFRKDTDADFDALLDSYLNGTEIQYFFADQLVATSGAQGLRAFCEVMDFPSDQPLVDGIVFNVVLGITPTEEASALVEPSWYEVP